jgi:four helix bundle protein
MNASEIPNPKSQAPNPKKSQIGKSQTEIQNVPAKRQAECFYMKHPRADSDQQSGKPYDIRERSMLFACVVRIAQELHHRGRIAVELSIQLVNAAVNAASNLDEADDGSSPRDFRSKDRIALRELKESRRRMRILRLTGYLKEKHDPTIEESTQLIKIVATMIRNSERNEANRALTKKR